MYHQTHVDSIAPFQEFQKFFRHSVYNRNKVYHYSVDEIIKEAAERVGRCLFTHMLLLGYYHHPILNKRLFSKAKRWKVRKKDFNGLSASFHQMDTLDFCPKLKVLKNMN